MNRGLHRAIPYGILALIALTLTLAAIGTDIARYDEDLAGATLDTKMDLWHLCQSTDQPVGTARSDTFCAPARKLRCTKLKDRLRAAEAFYIMTAIVLMLALVIAALDHGHDNYGSDHSSGHGFRHWKPLLLLLALLTIVFSIIGWALAFSVAREDFCEGDGDGIAFLAAKDRPNFEWRASPFLLLVSTVFGIAMFIVAFRAPHGSTEHVHPDRVRGEPTHA